MLSTLLTVIVVIAILGFVLWVVTTYVPMPEPVKRVLVVAVVLLLVLWLVRVLFGVSPSLRGL